MREGGTFVHPGENASVTINNNTFTAVLLYGILCFEQLVSTHNAGATALTISAMDNSKLWHQRIGQTSTLRIRRGLETSITQIDSCPTCMNGKISKIPFKGSFHETKSPLHVVHADICGPISQSTNSSARFFLTLVNQNSVFIHI